MRQLGLFAGIGGFELASAWMNWETVAWCENNDFCQKVLKHHFPNAIGHGDIKETDFTQYANQIDIITGGFPCQPFSTAGRGGGLHDERYLWEENIRAVREVKPRWVVWENVAGIASRKHEKVFEQICASLENEGYEVQPFDIPASAVGAEHERRRIWFVAHSKRIRLQGSGNVLGCLQPEKIGDRETSRFVNFIRKNSMPFMCNSHYGFSRKLAEQAVHAGGNAIVPQVVFEIYKAIASYEEQTREVI